MGADAQTVEQSVATPIEQQMSGVDNMNYMYSLNANNGSLRMIVDFDVKTDPNTDQVLAQMRESQAESQLPIDVRNYGVTVQKSPASPLMLFALYSPKGTYDGTFLANYAYINLNDQLTRVKGIASVTIFGAGQYAMRCWVRPDLLAKLNITVPEIVSALQKQNTVNPAGQIGGEPIPPGQEFTYAIRAQGRLVTPEEFGRIVLRANPDGSLVRLQDVARIELGTQDYDINGRFNGEPAALVAIYQTPGLERAGGGRGRQESDGPAKDVVPGRPRLHGRARHHPHRHRGDPGDRRDAVHRDGAGDHRGVRLPAGVARHADSRRRRAGLAHRHLRLLSRSSGFPSTRSP